MQRSAKILLTAGIGVVVLGVIAALAGPLIYRDFIAEPAAPPPTLTAEDDALEPGSGEVIDPSTLSGTWAVTEGSEAGYRVDEVLNGTEVTVTGRTDQVEGSATVDGLTLTDAEFTVDVASIATDRSQRDAYFRDSALRTDEHPSASFTLSEPVTADEAPTSGEVSEQELTGELTIAGVTKPVTATAQFRTDGTTVNLAGSIEITFEDFGVQAPSLGFVTVEPTGFVEFDLTLQKQ